MRLLMMPFEPRRRVQSAILMAAKPQALRVIVPEPPPIRFTESETLADTVQFAYRTGVTFKPNDSYTPKANLRVANIVTRALCDMRNRGIVFPSPMAIEFNQIKVKVEEEKSRQRANRGRGRQKERAYGIVRDVTTTGFATLDPVKPPVVYFNADVPNWDLGERPAHIRELSRMERSGIVDTDARAAVYHEMGHVLHQAELTDTQRYNAHKAAFKTAISDKGFKTSVQEALSQRATVDAFEFVSEVFAAQMLGERVPTRMMALYAQFNGPVIPTVVKP